MTDTTIAAGQGATTQAYLDEEDTLVVERLATLVTDAANPAGASAVFVAGGARVDNAGLISTFSSDPSRGADPVIAGWFGVGGQDFVIRNRETGVLRSENDVIDIELQDGETASVLLDNAGLIYSEGGRAVDLGESTYVRIINRETGRIIGEGADIMRPGEGTVETVQVLNAGYIGENENPRNAGGDAIDFQDGGGRVRNYATGVIEGGRHGITGDASIVVVNAAGGVIRGRNGAGINMDTNEDAAPVRIDNFGLIQGGFDRDRFDDGDGDGVDVDGLLSLDNRGVIVGADADNEDDFADGVAAGGGEIVNRTGAAIFGATNGILVDDSDGGAALGATRIFNSGSIEGAYQVPHPGAAIRLVGDWADTIINRGSIVSYASSDAVAIDTGGGGDTVTFEAGATSIGWIRLGAGTDRFGSAAVASAAVDGGEGADTIKGGSGEDTLVGGAGADELAGRGGADLYLYRSSAESNPLTGRDRVLGFTAEDRIDLSAIDADGDASNGDTAFTFIGSASLGGGTGLLRARTKGGDTIVSADIDGDGAADLVIEVRGYGPMSADDFVL